MNRINSSHGFSFFYGSLFLIVLISTIWFYWPGLSSLFLLDDSPNLEKLTTIHNISQFGQFITEGFAGQLGRPVSLLTFALQAHHWPSNPWAFKYVNLMIHLLNGCLIFGLIFYLSRQLKLSEKRSLLLALMTTSVWLWHPIHVSTVLYVIQRMTQLSVFFTLAGLFVYLKGRQQLAEGQIKSGFFWVSLGIGLGGLLAVLSKENGILLVLYVIVLEMTILRTLPKPRYWRIWSGVFLYLPLLLLILFFATHVDSLLRAYEIRDFTMGERLLTQARVLFDYLFKILLPRPQMFGLFQDDYPISHDLLNPPSTVIAIIFMTGLLIAAIQLRHLFPVFSFGILWFLAGHLLESSFIGLVIVFDHRNYLPSLGILFAASYGLLWLFDQMSIILRRLAIFLSFLWLVLLALITGFETELWSKPLEQAIIWAKQHTLSRFAQSHAANVLAETKNFSEMEKYYQHMIKVFPQDSGPYLLWLAAGCKEPEVKPPPIKQILHHLAQNKIDIAVPNTLNFIVNEYTTQKCPRLSSQTIHQLFETTINNPKIVHYKDEILFLYAKFHSYEENYDQAIQQIEQAIAIDGTPLLKMQRLSWLIKAHRFDEALSYIQQIRQEFNLFSQFFYAKQLNQVEAFAHQLKDFTQQKDNPIDR